MEKNKSIDGLVSRRPKKTTPKTKTQPKPKTPTKKAPAKKNVKKVAVTSPAPAQEPKTEKTNVVNAEDFLKPVKAFDFDEETGKLKVAEESKEKPKKMKKEKKEKKKAGKVRKTLSIIALLIVLILIGGVVWVILWGNDIIAKITGGQGNVFDLIFTDETYEPLKTDANGRTNILAFGTSGYNMDGEEGNGTHDGAQLTDSIMILSLNQETGDLAMLSLPRDLKASPTCTATGKINEVYWCNGGNGDISTEEEAVAAQALMNEVGSILDIDFQYFVHVNWGSLVQIVDILDGITVTLDEDVHDYYHFDAGNTYTLRGDEALWLARMRYGTANGDFSRANSQQKILIGIKDRIFEKKLSITDLLSLASTLGDNLRSNFSIDELKTLAHLTYEFDFDSMRQLSLIDPEYLVTTGTINGISYVLPVGGVGNYLNIQNYVAKMLNNDPRTYEEPTILILNGTDEEGLAKTEKQTLEAEGYTDITIDNAPEGEYTEKYSLYGTNTKPSTKRMLEEYYNTVIMSFEKLPKDVSTDYDFIIILGGLNQD
ncbi:LCP family protein [Candidatus Saccharibacteria bacterium]|nr:LCP family protein [Candidatus Saccharibacteria bacterium]